MFGLGFSEVFILFISIIVFIRPKDLPLFFRYIGRVYGQLKSMYTQFMREINLADVHRD